MVNQNSGNPLVRAAVRTVLTGGALAAAVGVANAQQAPATAPTPASAQLQEIVVTGSRIAVPNQVSLSPVTFIPAAAIAQTGTTRVEDMLNQLPQVFADQGSNIVNGATGTATVDLRGLGAKRTLVLIDGQRMNPGDPRIGAAADLNMIPEALISSVEILTGGASSIYGADAVAGVVNFKLNEHFQGVELIANGGIYQNDNTNTQGVIDAITNFNTKTGNHFAYAPSSTWGGAQKQLTFIAGFNTPDGNGNATFYASYRNVAAILQSQYSVSACSLASGYYSNGKPGALTCSGSSNSFPGRFIHVVATSSTLDDTIGPGGTLVPFTSADRFNYGPLNYFQRPDERYTAGAFMHYTLNEHFTAYESTMFMDDHSLAQIAPSAAFLGPTYTVNCSNPFLSASELAGWCGGSTAGTTSLYIGRRNIEGGNRFDDLEHSEFREVVGAKGGINNDWTYDASFQYGLTDLSEVYHNDMSFTKIGDALDVVIDPSTGQPACAVTLTGVSNGLGAGCVPWNIFGNGGTAYMPPSAATSYLDTPGVQRGRLAQTIVELDLTGDLSQYVHLPTANSGLKVAIGGDYRDDTTTTTPDAEFQTGDLTGQGGKILPLSGDIITREGYAEARMPLVDNKPFAQAIDLDVSYRLSAYSPPDGALKGFSTNTYAFSADWKPTNDYRIRASFSRAVRAPNVGELYSAQAVVLDGVTDPCAGIPATAACARTGIPLGYVVKPAPASQYNGLEGGNPNLQPETALTTSFGIGWTPSYIPNLRLQLDYYDIKIDNIIERIGADTILKQCLDNNLFCSAIHRGPLYTLWLTGGYVSDLNVNAGKMEEKGLDVDFGYMLPLHGLGHLQVGLIGTYVGSLDNTPIASFPASGYDCAGYYGPVCGTPTPKWRHNMRLTWMTPWDGIDISAAWRYYAPVSLDALSPNPSLGALSSGATIANGGISNTDAHLSSYSYFDLTAAVALPAHVKLRLGVNNVLDKQPPVIGTSDLPGVSGNGNTFPQVYDSLGRYIFAEVSMQF